MNGRVLLVEDERDAREALARAFERAGWSCAQAEDVAGALAALDGEPPDAAVLDLVLGADDRGGIELVPRVRAKAPDAPIVVITAFADVDRVKHVLNDGASYLLEKPFAARDLLDVVTRLIDRRAGFGHLVDRALARAKLTEKEANIARLLLKGLPTAEIARLEGNSDKTIRQHVSQVYAKCGVSTRAEFFHYVFPT